MEGQIGVFFKTMPWLFLLFVKKFLTKYHIPVLDHPHYSPDLAMSTAFLLYQCKMQCTLQQTVGLPLYFH